MNDGFDGSLEINAIYKSKTFSNTKKKQTAF